ncbi:MAG: aminotransferase class V-fold PLP-dependent enzyme [Chloroflexales bacterium]|nr:aminotransferase class V-fold PLP-dependent enzyme [Chloroflexales bacterium]
MSDLTHYRAEFPLSERYTFLSHAAISPLNRRAANAVSDYVALVRDEPMTSHSSKLLALQDDLRQRIATLINARSSNEIALLPNTATSINTIALSLPLHPGDNVLVLDGDYPANIYPWLNLAHKGVLTKFVPQHDGGLNLNRLEQRIDHRTRVIALSTVMFATGFHNDIAAVGQLCQDRGIYFCVDGIQSLGVFPMDVQKFNIDFLAAGAQKWLLGLSGSGFLYCRREWFDDLAPGAYVGALNVVDPFNFLDYNFTLPANADRFTIGTPNTSANVALHASIGLLQEVGIERISQHVSGLIDALINDLTERGYELAASTAPEHRSGIVVAKVPDPKASCKQLEQVNIIATPRGAGVRFAPHFYNTLEEILRVGEVLGDY